MHLHVLVCYHHNTTISVNWHPLVQLERGTLIQVILSFELHHSTVIHSSIKVKGIHCCY